MAEDISNVSAGDGEIQKCYSSAPRRLPAVGRVYNAAGQRSAVRWAPDGAGGYTLQDLGDLGGGEADVRTINHAGQVAGYSTRRMEAGRYERLSGRQGKPSRSSHCSRARAAPAHSR